MKLTATLSLLLCTSLFAVAEAPQETAPAKNAANAAAPETFICPPCGAECHFDTSTKPGSCGVCGMALVPLASVPQVGVLLHPDVALPSSMLVLALFAGSDAVRAFSVADTAEPLRLSDALEVRPQFSFVEAPALDVLVVPEGYGAWDDALLVEWVAAAAERARFVLAVESGSVVLARAGFLAGEKVPARDFLQRRGKELAPGLEFDGAVPWRRAGKFFLARDTDGAIDATLALVAELAGAEQAQQTADAFGRAWTPEPR